MVAKPHTVTRLLSALGLAAALALPVAGCNPAVPDRPTYDHDVQPILTARCVRCHGAGGNLNAIPGVPTALPQPQLCYLQTYDNIPAGCAVGAAGCSAGAGYCAGMLSTYINGGDNAPLRMPPKPSDPLSDWEKEVLTKWGALMPPPKS